jgi:hypothetical protein
MAKPYQPTSPEWEAKSLGVSGAVWIDGDGNRRRTSCREYAEQIYAADGSDSKDFAATLSRYDAAVAAQAAHCYRLANKTTWRDDLAGAMERAAPSVKVGFRRYLEAWRASEFDRAQR